ncbi:PleD family two-component system response regulator [Mucilaginibacter calamicampi]|uniref:PleD family two-component system response regulator n=1 Tax=Mucilaginibacter calamicampi TaxID=1302352 RepID=A0ABW2Z0L1_9SPHI
MKRDKILVVDDDNDILEIVTLLLAGRGYEVKALNHGETIFEDIRDFQPHLVLMDVMLGEMDGREICKGLKSDPLTRELPVILISGTHDLVESLHLPGAPDDFIAKPFDLDQLYGKIDRHLAA